MADLDVLSRPATPNQRRLPFFDLHDEDFEEILVEICDKEPGIVRADLKLIGGVAQYGVDVEGFDAQQKPVLVISCKCYRKVIPSKLAEWSSDFLNHITDHWTGKGVPGTGKTLLARMLGEACGVPVVVSSIAELFANSSGYLNDVIKALRKTFDEARAKAPSILFLDEINALPNIDQVGERNKDYWAPVIFDFYTLLDGAMSGRDGVIVIGATNRIEDIHPALLRPGRLERAIHVGAPDAAGVERIMRHHLGDDLADVELGKLAIQNVGRGATGAVVMEQVRAARRLARRAGRPMVMEDLESQILEEDTRTPEELRRSAVHESGHVITGLAIGSTLDLVNINMSGDNGGCARLSIPTGTLVTRDQIEGMVMSLLGGRAAEQLLLGEPSQGAGGSADSDLARCTSMLASLEASLGLGSSLLFRSLPEDAWQLLREPDFRRRVEKLLDELYQRTIDILHARRPALEAVIEALLEHRFLTGKEVESIIENSESVVENRESVVLFGVPREPAATG